MKPGNTLPKPDVIESLRALPYAREMQAYLIEFAANATGKQKPSGGFIRDLNRPSGTFVDARDINHILEQAQEIFRANGFRKPWDLENDLIALMHPDMPQQAIENADFYGNAEMAPDRLTGFHQKPQAPLSMAWASVFTEETGMPVAVLEIDYSNMRGTNDYYYQLLRAAHSGKNEAELYREAMSLTDRAAYLVAQTIRATLRDHVPPALANHMIFLRTGGDEARVIMPGLATANVHKLIDMVHDNIEELTARLGLHDHRHGKPERANDPLSNGFGAALTTYPLMPGMGFEDEIKDADRRIQDAKQAIGMARLDSSYFNALKPEPTLEAIIERLGHAESRFGVNPPAAPHNDIESIIAAAAPDTFMPLERLRQNLFDRFTRDAGDDGIALTKEQLRILRIKVLRFPAMDYAANTLMARDLPVMAAAALKITDDIGHRTGEIAPLLTMGVSFHNLSGMNEVLGHEAANALLRHQAQEVVEQSLFKGGLSRENFYMAHMGGGEFRFVIQPVIPDDSGLFARVITREDIQIVTDEIISRTAELNAKDVKVFLNARSIPYNGKYSAFGNIPNPRLPGETGIDVTVSAKPYDLHRPGRGGAIVDFIGDYLKAAIDEKRAKISTLITAPTPSFT